MKKRSLFITVLVLTFSMCACVKESIERPEKKELQVETSAPEFNVTFVKEGGETKSYIGEDNMLYWTAEDCLSVFSSTTDNQKYVFCGQTGDRTGTIRKVVSDSELNGSEISVNYAVYPYNAANTLDDEGVLTVMLPQTQKYAQNSFGPESNTMVAVTESTDERNLAFKNVGAYLVLKLYGDISIKSVTITGNTGEKLSGAADVSIAYGSAPSLSMHNDAGTSVTLDCGTGVTLGNTASEATEFWFVLPSVTFSNGFTVKVTDTAGKSFSRSKITAGSLSRNSITTVSPFSVTTKAGEFVRMINDEETFNENTLETLAREYLSDGIMTIFPLVYKLIAKDLKVNRVVYTTTDREGNIVEASGLITYPADITTRWSSNKKYRNIYSVHHVTCEIPEAPTLTDIPYELMPAYKSGTDIVVLADYLGYGVSRTADYQHPYMHNELTGKTCADLIEAARKFLKDERGLSESTSMTINLVGYSQGAASAISTLYELEKRGYKNKIGSIDVGGGPYDLNVFFNQIVENITQPYPRTGFIAYLVRGLDYGDNLNLNFRNVFAKRIFDNGYDKMLSNGRPGSWSIYLGSDIRNVLHPDIFEEGFNDNADIIKLVGSLSKNSVINLPLENASKIKIYHSITDDTVPYECSVKAAEKWNCSFEELESIRHDDAGIEFYAKFLNPYIWDLVKGFI